MPADIPDLDAIEREMSGDWGTYEGDLPLYDAAAALLAYARDLKAMLEKHRWVGAYCTTGMAGAIAPCCPRCGARPNESHDMDCEPARLIGASQEER